MADNRQIGIDIFIDSKNAANSLGELKKSIKDLKNEALNFEQGSAEFNKLTAAAGQLNDKIADINGTVKVLSGNTTENLTRSFSGVAQAGVGGFQAIIGAQALFGDKNEDLQKQLVKLQGVMNFAAGLREFANLGQAAKDFKTVILSLIPTIATKTAVTEADTAVQQQNTFSLIAAGVSSAALAVKNGILSASTVVVTGLTEAFGITATAAWAAATLGVSLLITGIIALVAYWDDINAKVEEFGVAGKIAFGLILGPIGAVYQGIVAIGEALGFLDDETEKSAERRAEAEAKYKDSIESSNKSLGESRRRILVATGQISEEEAKRQKAKEDFITNYLKLQEDARVKIKEATSTEEKAVIKKDLDLKIKALQNEYSATLVEINQGEKKKNEAKAKSDADAAKAASDKAKAAREKQAADDLKDTEAFNQKLVQAQSLLLSEKERIDKEAQDKEKALKAAFNDLTLQEQKTREEEKNKAIEAIQKDAQKKKDAIDKEAADKKAAQDEDDKRKAQEKSDAFLSTLISNSDARLSAEEAITNEGNNRKLELERQFGELSAEEQITRKQQLDNELKAIDKETNAKIQEQNQETASKQIQLENDIKNAKGQFALQALDIVSSLADTFGKKNEKAAKRAFEINKAASIAQAVISTYLGVQNIFASAAANPKSILFPAQPFIAAGLALGAGLANVAKIAKTQFKGTTTPSDSNTTTTPDLTGGGGGSAGGPNTAPPIFNLQGQQLGGASGFLSTSGTNGQNQPIKVFVTETDISNVQGKVQVIQGNSLFGGSGG